MILVTHEAPDFTAAAVLNNGTIINNFNLSKFIKNKYAVIFFWPMDFTFVCPSEIISFDKHYEKFQKRGVEIIGVSIDSVFVHNAWRLISPNNGGIGSINYPIVADIKRKIINSYGIEHIESGVALRASFLVDKNRIVRHQVINDLPLGRNVHEMLRMVDALQFYEANGYVCPAQWELGQEGMEASPKGVKEYLTKYIDKL